MSLIIMEFLEKNVFIIVNYSYKKGI